jgi:6-phospho-beta-glucosidase
VKITVLGGSSPSTPALFRFLGTQSKMPRMEFCLVGRSREHLSSVLRAARTVAAEAPISLQSCSFARAELASALCGADVVLVQVRFGGYQGRNFDETFPLRYGLCGDEGLGPGGLSAAWRAWPAMRNLLTTVASVCPDAIILMLSSPVGVLVGAARHMFPFMRIYGICELPWTTLQEVSSSLNADPTGTDFDYLGVNHIGWFYRMEYEGRDLLLEYNNQGSSDETWPSSQLVSSCGGFPTKYLRLHYDQQQVLEEQRHRRVSRADVLQEVSLESYRVYWSGEKHAILAALERRPAPWYDHAVAPFLLSLAGVPSAIPCFLTGPGWLTDADFDFEDLLEVPICVNLGQFSPKSCRKPPPPHILDTVKAFLAYERKATCAVVEQDGRQIQNALNIHPWIGKPELAAALTAQITAQPQVEAN